jgi:hypothetical protein
LVVLTRHWNPARVQHAKRLKAPLV